MKITFDVECTPEEARRLMGLPDVTGVHDAYLSRMQSAIEQGVTPDAMRAVLQTWGPMGEAGLSMWRQFLDQVGGGKSKG